MSWPNSSANGLSKLPGMSRFSSGSRHGLNRAKIGCFDVGRSDDPRREWRTVHVKSQAYQRRIGYPVSEEQRKLSPSWANAKETRCSKPTVAAARASQVQTNTRWTKEKWGGL
jgi:hypothetical protein